MTTIRKILRDIAGWECWRDGHKMSSDGKWRTCSECGYTEKA